MRFSTPLFRQPSTVTNGYPDSLSGVVDLCACFLDVHAPARVPPRNRRCDDAGFAVQISARVGGLADTARFARELADAAVGLAAWCEEQNGTSGAHSLRSDDQSDVGGYGCATGIVTD